MKVHRTMGPGFQEVIYQCCLAVELERAGLSFAGEQEQAVYYDGIQVGARRADFVVENQVVVELKALVKLEDVNLAEAIDYSVAYNFLLGLLITFGGKSLDHKLGLNNRQDQDLQDWKARRIELAGSMQNLDNSKVPKFLIQTGMEMDSYALRVEFA